MVTSLIGIFVVVVVSQATKGNDIASSSLWLVGSIGASAVLVFGVPHGPLSQPWAVLGGHGVSAIVGIVVAHAAGGGPFAAALAVAAAIGAMHVMRCIHPPGGATALAAVMMTTAGRVPSWQYPLTPVLLNAATIVVAAIVLNAPFAWRRYPIAWAFPHPQTVRQESLGHEPPFTREQLDVALRELGSVVYISDDELQALYQSLRRQQTWRGIAAADLRVGAYYSNGSNDSAWAVRRIIYAGEPGERDPTLIVKTVAGNGLGAVDSVAPDDFAAWSAYEVEPSISAWQRADAPA